MGYLIGFLTVVMVLDCVVLMLLVLIQLPKKDAGAGLAFGGGATDALFGAGAGNVLTKITKYSAGIFFVLAIALSVMQRNYQTRSTTIFQENLNKPVPSASVPRPATAPAVTPASTPAVTGTTNRLPLSLPLVESTNLPATSNSPAATNLQSK